jgi:hypothetical protein
MSKPTTATTANSAISGTAARVAFGAAASFLVLILALHVIKPEIDPSWRFISEYAIGNHGWILMLAFFTLAAACVALVVAIRPEVRTIAGRIGLAGLLSMAVGLAIAAVFTTDPITTPPDAMTTTGKLHAFGGSLGIGMPLANVLVTWTLVRNPRWAHVRFSLLLTGGLAIAGTLTFIGALAYLVPPGGSFGPDVPVGWPNRFEALAMSMWLMTLAWHATALGRGTSKVQAAQRAVDNRSAAA